MMENRFETPILLITFNRPDYVRRVLTEIRKQQPSELYVCQDGPREENEKDQINIHEVRNVINELVDWPCNLHTLFQEKNLGCGPGPAKGISWFFDSVEKGIIIEDDAVPHQDFFQYAEELLERYKGDASVRAIGSMNVDRHKWGDGSYYFSMMNRNLCAWATWRRAWKDFDINMADISRSKLSSALGKYGCGILEREYWCDRLFEIHKDGCGGASWDMQFFMSIWLNHGKGIIPYVNLSSNIGTVGEATHQLGLGNIIDNIPTCPILPLVHPSNKNIQSKADDEFHFRYFESDKINWGKCYSLYNVLLRRLKRLIGFKGSLRKKFGIS